MVAISQFKGGVRLIHIATLFLLGAILAGLVGMTRRYGFVNIDFSDSTLLVNSNKFALETVFSNLINNAIFYSPNNTAIEIAVSKTSERKVLIKISNICHEETQENDLKLFFDPLWQKDSSRTSTERFGLGLAIVSTSKGIMSDTDARKKNNLIESNIDTQMQEKISQESKK